MMNTDSDDGDDRTPMAIQRKVIISRKKKLVALTTKVSAERKKVTGKYTNEANIRINNDSSIQ